MLFSKEVTVTEEDKELLNQHVNALIEALDALRLMPYTAKAMNKSKGYLTEQIGFGTIAAYNAFLHKANDTCRKAMAFITPLHLWPEFARRIGEHASYVVCWDGYSEEEGWKASIGFGIEHMMSHTREPVSFKVVN